MSPYLAVLAFVHFRLWRPLAHHDCHRAALERWQRFDVDLDDERRVACVEWEGMRCVGVGIRGLSKCAVVDNSQLQLLSCGGKFANEKHAQNERRQKKLCSSREREREKNEQQQH